MTGDNWPVAAIIHSGIAFLTYHVGPSYHFEVQSSDSVICLQETV